MIGKYSSPFISEDTLAFKTYKCFCLKLQTVIERDSICIQGYLTVNLQ